MSLKFATRLRRRQRNRQKVLNILALLGTILLPIYPVFGNYVQSYTGSIVRGNFDASTILSTYDPTSGEYIMSNVLDGNGISDISEEVSDPAQDLAVLENIDIVPDPVAEQGPKEDPKKILYPIHIVTPKQTLEAILKQYSVSLDLLKNANPGLTSDLKIDQKIVIPTIRGVEYIVKKGDTLSVIAARYGVINLYHILVANDLSNASKLRIGQKLLLPNPTKDPNPKKTPPVPLAAQKTPTKKSPTKAPNAVASTPKTLTYGTYSLNLKVEKGCRNFAWGNCTCFVAKYKNVTWRGNAKQWLRNAQKSGALTGQDPKPGAIIVYDGYGYSPYYGHVGIVMEVGEDYIIVKDMNYSALNQITTRRENFKNNKAIKGYIYVD